MQRRGDLKPPWAAGTAGHGPLRITTDFRSRLCFNARRCLESTEYDSSVALLADVFRYRLRRPFIDELRSVMKLVAVSLSCAGQGPSIAVDDRLKVPMKPVRPYAEFIGSQV